MLNALGIGLAGTSIVLALLGLQWQYPLAILLGGMTVVAMLAAVTRNGPSGEGNGGKVNGSTRPIPTATGQRPASGQNDHQ